MDQIFEYFNNLQQFPSLPCRMLPIGRDYCSTQFQLGIFPYSQPGMFFHSFSPWAPQYNYFSTWSSLGSQNPVSCEVPSETTQSRKLSFEKNSVPEKQTQSAKMDSGLIRNELSQQQNKLKVFRQSNKSYCDDESSYNIKQRKGSAKGRKTKRAPQNSNRNILPSLVQQILSFLTKTTKSKQVCQRVFLKLANAPDTPFTVSRYYSFIKSVKDKQNHYMNQKTLEVLTQTHEIGINLFSREEQMFYLRVARVMAKHFLVEMCPFLIMRSKRITQEKRVEHLSIRRTLLATISRLGC